MSKNILSDLDLLIKKAKDSKLASAKKAEDVSAALNQVDDGTKPATTGEQASANKSDAAGSTAAMVDGGAKPNETNASVENNTAGAEAMAADGSAGAAAGEMAVTQTQTAGEGAEDIVKMAKDLSAELEKTASGLLTKLDHFLVKSARASSDEALRKVAMEASEDDLADQASDVLMEQLNSGEISDEEAEQILSDALAEGAITEEDLAAAQELASQAGGSADGAAPAPEAAAPEAAAPEAAAAPAEEGVEDPALEEKLAAAEVGPEHKDYIKKLAHFYPSDIENGYKHAMKLAEELLAEENAEPAGDPAVPAEEGVGADETVEHEASEGEIPAPATEEEAQALAAVQKELGLSDEQLAELMAAEVPKAETKLAAAKAAYSSKILAKVAALKVLKK